MEPEIEKELEEMAKNRIKRRHFVEFITNKWFWIPFSIIIVILIDDPDIRLVTIISKVLKHIFKI